MAIAVIDKDGDLTVEVIEYDDRVVNNNGNRPVTRTQHFRVRQEVLTKNSKVFTAMFRPSHWREAQQEFVQLEEDSVASMDVWFRILHDTDAAYDVPLEEMWRLVTACDKYQFNLSMLKPWFATWYQKHNIDQYYVNWVIKDRHNTDLLDPRSLLYPCWIFDHQRGFMRATFFLSYNSVGHITEYNPTIHRDLRLENRVIQQLNAAKGRLRTVIHNELFRPNEKLLTAHCKCKEMTLFCYEKALYTIDVWPLERVQQKASMTTIIQRLNNFSFEAKEDVCHSCRSDYKNIVKVAQEKTRSYFDGLCLDCMDRTKPVTGDADMDYWQHDTLRESDFMDHCRSKHRQPTWYFSFMGRRDVMDRFLRNKRKQNSWDSD